MTLDELIEKLTELRDEEGVPGDALVMMAHQPNYPLQCGIAGPVVDDEPLREAQDIEDHLPDGIALGYFEDEEDLADARKRAEELRKKSRPIVYILEGQNYPWYKDKEIGCYASRDLWDR